MLTIDRDAQAHIGHHPTAATIVCCAMRTRACPLSVPQPQTALEKIVTLCKEGLGRDTLRREMWCQLLKQLHGNPSKGSAARGWILLNMYLGSFPPPKEMFPVLKSFIAKGPTTFREFSATRLLRMQTNGGRVHPPLFVELHSVKKRMLLNLPVTIPGGEVSQIAMDSLTTVGEILENACRVVGLKSTRGFGIRINTGDVSTSAGEGNFKILDVISSAQDSFGQGAWKLELTKELFAPWHSPLASDEVALEVVALQVFRTVAEGKWRLPSDEEYIKFLVRRYYIEYGDMDDVSTRSARHRALNALHISHVRPS
jgi:myosin-7